MRTTTGARSLAFPIGLFVLMVLGGCSGNGGGSPDGTGGGTTGGSSGTNGGGSGGTLGGSGGATGGRGGGTAGTDGASSGSGGAMGGSGGGTAGTGGVAAGGRGGAATGTGGAGGGSANGRRPNPIISRGKTVFSMPAGGAAVVDGNYHNGGWSAGTPTAAATSWVAIRLGAGPSRILVVWDDGGTYNYQDPTSTTVYGLPSAYHIDVSADSTNGNDGTWTPAVSITANQVRTRGHSMDFTGKSWVKMVITGAPANESTNGVQIGEIDVHDLSLTGTALPDDTWYFMGDSITAFSYDRAAAHQPSFATLINTMSPTFFPAMINGGIGGEKASDGLARLAATLTTLAPDYRTFVLSYGTNDAGTQAGTATFQTNMQSMITMVKAAGRIPIIPHIPYSGDGGHGMVPQYNAIIDTLVQSNGLMAGPDLYTYFMQHTTEFMTDNLHPNDAGQLSINRLWAAAMRSLYP